MAALVSTAVLADGLDRRLGDLAGAVLLCPAIEQRLDDFADLAGVVDIADRQHAGNEQRVNVLFTQIDTDQVVFLLAGGHRHWPPGRLRGWFNVCCGRDLDPLRPLGRLLHPQRLLQPLSRAAQALQAVARRRPQVFRLAERLLEPADLSLHQRELAAQAGNDLRPQATLVIGDVNYAVFALTHGSILRPLITRHRRSPALPILPLRTLVVAVVGLAIVERALCHRPRLMLQLAHSSLRQLRSMRRASSRLSDWRHKTKIGGRNGLTLLRERGARTGPAISRTGSPADRCRRTR